MPKIILLLIDFQSGFVGRGAQELVPKMEQLVADERIARVIATKFVNTEGSLWDRLHRWDGLKSETEQALAVALPADAVIVEKRTYCLPAEFLNRELEFLKSGAVVLAGIEADACVTIIAAQLFDHGIAPYILRNHVASTKGAATAERSLESLERILSKNRVISSLDEITDND